MNTQTPHLIPSPAIPPPRRRAHASAPAVEIVIPVYNEQHVLESSVRTLHSFLTRELDLAFRITIADNASSDGTLQVAEALARELPGVAVRHLERKGRGRALRAAWGASAADVVAYMDVDLSTDLAALPALLEPLTEGRADIAIGSRLAPGAQVTRSLRRELISRSYNLLLAALLGARFSDAQCGFKAGRREIVQALLPEVADEAWFFDTELLYRAQRARLAIHEVPVRWVEDPDSRVDLIATAREDLRGVMRLRGAANMPRNPRGSACSPADPPRASSSRRSRRAPTQRHPEPRPAAR